MNLKYQKFIFATLRLCGFALIFSVIFTNAQKPIKDLKPTVILISLDGFHPDYLEKYKPPVLNKLAKNGVRAKWMIPSYPTKTFPNHYTTATGLYPDNHGIIENNMYDPETKAVFGLDKREELRNPRWWGGEPIWVTAEKQGKTAAAFFFPGTETPIKGVQPSIWKDYDHDFPNDKRIDEVLSWLDLPVKDRPQMITLYFADVDDAGHRAGPDSTDTKTAVWKVDANLDRLMRGLKARKVDKKVNLIITSDHGMQPYKMRDAVVLDDYFDVNDAERIFWVGEFTQIFPKPGKEETIYNQIKAKLPSSAEIYRRGEFPARFKFGKNSRIAPIVVIPKAGAIITNRERYDAAVKKGTLDNTRGGHGYDNELPSMKALFIAHGEAFKKRKIVEPFENIEIYNLMCVILGLTPAPNDGNFEKVKEMLKREMRNENLNK